MYFFVTHPEHQITHPIARAMEIQFICVNASQSSERISFDFRNTIIINEKMFDLYMKVTNWNKSLISFELSKPVLPRTSPQSQLHMKLSMSKFPSRNHVQQFTAL